MVSSQNIGLYGTLVQVLCRPYFMKLFVMKRIRMMYPKRYKTLRVRIDDNVFTVFGKKYDLGFKSGIHGYRYILIRGGLRDCPNIVNFV